jgi:hypothetical protein
MKPAGSILDVLAALLAVGAGVYLLSASSPAVQVGGATGQSWLEILAHGIGVYFIAKGIWMARSLHLAAEQRAVLVKLTELVAFWRDQPPG